MSIKPLPEWELFVEVYAGPLKSHISALKFSGLTQGLYFFVDAGVFSSFTILL